MNIFDWKGTSNLKSKQLLRLDGDFYQSLNRSMYDSGFTTVFRFLLLLRGQPLGDGLFKGRTVVTAVQLKNNFIYGL